MTSARKAFSDLAVLSVELLRQRENSLREGELEISSGFDRAYRKLGEVQDLIEETEHLISLAAPKTTQNP